MFDRFVLLSILEIVWDLFSCTWAGESVDRIWASPIAASPDKADAESAEEMLPAAPLLVPALDPSILPPTPSPVAVPVPVAAVGTTGGAAVAESMGVIRCALDIRRPPSAKPPTPAIMPTTPPIELIPPEEPDPKFP